MHGFVGWEDIYPESPFYDIFQSQLDRGLLCRLTDGERGGLLDAGIIDLYGKFSGIGRFILFGRESNDARSRQVELDPLLIPVVPEREFGSRYRVSQRVADRIPPPMPGTVISSCSRRRVGALTVSGSSSLQAENTQIAASAIGIADNFIRFGFKVKKYVIDLLRSKYSKKNDNSTNPHRFFSHLPHPKAGRPEQV
ncbi:hypothetical protein [uncultured Alistipes sp.]|uniref:hypothetical protein n=1 Tax=Alistipes sp. TaxID=1872444 RepID=UPI00266C66D8|nr:hypothetical protein [uncultured Alistipes sp.]